MQTGLEEIVQSLPAEWLQFELNAKKKIEETLRANYLTITQLGEEGTFQITYNAETKGGVKWGYTDQGFIAQVLFLNGSTVKVVSTFEVWTLNYNPKTSKPYKGPETFVFDWIQPVKDFNKAVSFYKEFFGESGVRTSTKSMAWDVKGGRFIIEENGDLLQLPSTIAEVKKNLPNGFARFLVDNLQAAKAKLKHSAFLLNTSVTNLITKSKDECLVNQDLGGNVFLTCEEKFLMQEVEANKFETKLLGDWGELPSMVFEFWRDWAMFNSSSLFSKFLRGGMLFDSSRRLDKGPIVVNGFSAFHDFLNVDWNLLDHANNKGIVGYNLSLSKAKQFVINSNVTLVSYDLKLVGGGRHALNEDLHVSQVSWNGLIYFTFVCAFKKSTGIIKSFDYTGYPQTKLEAARNFYQNKLGLGNPYEDYQYYGFWS